MRRIVVLAIALVMMTSVASAQRGVFTLTDESCAGGIGALTARIDSPGHQSAETICYLDRDESGSFTPASDQLLFVSHDNEITGCQACLAKVP